MKEKKKDKRDDEEKKDDEIDFYKYPMCVYVGTNTADRTVDLSDKEDREEMGIVMGGPSNNYITLPFSYGMDKSTITVTITYAPNTDSSIASVTKEVQYNGENVVFGITPSSMNGTNTCAYSSKPVALPFSEFFYQKFTSADIIPLSDYDLMSSVLYLNGAATPSERTENQMGYGAAITLVTGFCLSQKITQGILGNEVIPCQRVRGSPGRETLTLNNGIQSSAANKCQYYQITRRNERLSDSLWSYNYQTVLVETLGWQGSNSDYKQSDWDKPTVTWINGTVGKTDMTVTCQAVNEDKKGTIAMIDIMCPHMDIVEKVDGVEGADDCSYNASVTIDMTKLSDPCMLTCMAKSQCSYYEVKEHVVNPSKYRPLYSLYPDPDPPPPPQSTRIQDCVCVWSIICQRECSTNIIYRLFLQDLSQLTSSSAHPCQQVLGHGYIIKLSRHVKTLGYGENYYRARVAVFDEGEREIERKREKYREKKEKIPKMRMESFLGQERDREREIEREGERERERERERNRERGTEKARFALEREREREREIERKRERNKFLRKEEKKKLKNLYNQCLTSDEKRG
eukprot:sb/3479395/